MLTENLDGIPVDDYQGDVTGPVLLQFVALDWDSGTIELRFDEVVNTSTADSSAITIRNDFVSDSTIPSYTLQRGSVITEEMYSQSVRIRMADSDLYNLKSSFTVCTPSTPCWIRFTPSLVDDTSSNDVQPIFVNSSSSDTAARTIPIPDSTPPQLESYYVDLDSGLISMTFDEPLDYLTFDPSHVTFHAAANVSASELSLSGPSVLTFSHVSVMNFSISNDDINSLKAVDSFFTDENTTFLSFTSALVADRFGNAIEISVVDVNSTMPELFIADTSDPTVEEFSEIDLDDNRLIVAFNEPVDISKLNYSLIQLFNGGSIVFTLEGRDVQYTDSSKLSIFIYLSNNDIRNVKTTSNLCSSSLDCQINVLEGAVCDVSGNPVEPYSNLVVTTYNMDTRRPQLISFNLDMNSETLHLTFDDVVKASSFTPHAVTLQADKNGSLADFTYTLSSVVPPTVDDFVIDVKLMTVDSNGIKAIPQLGTQIGNTYISITAQTIVDTFDVNVVSILGTEALQASNVTVDSIRPNLTDSLFDLDAGTLQLTFDEVVSVTTLDVTQITIQNSNNPTEVSFDQFTLTGGILESAPYPDVFTIEMTREDLNYIKLQVGLASSSSSVFISITNATVLDTNSNHVNAVEQSDPNVPAYIPDVSTPYLESFTFDLNSGVILMTFDETVNASHSQPTDGGIER